MEGTYKLLYKIGLLYKRHLVTFHQYKTNQSGLSYKLLLMSYFISQTINIKTCGLLSYDFLKSVSPCMSDFDLYFPLLLTINQMTD